jgi:hypothetical protein
MKPSHSTAPSVAVTIARPRYGVERPLPAVAVSIADSLAMVTLEPHTAELSEDIKAAIVAADRQRVFIDARYLKPADYPQEALAFLFSNATLVCARALDCGKPGAEDDIEAAHNIRHARGKFILGRKAFHRFPWRMGRLHRKTSARGTALPLLADIRCRAGRGLICGVILWCATLRIVWLERGIVTRNAPRGAHDPQDAKAVWFKPGQ